MNESGYDLIETPHLFHERRVVALILSSSGGAGFYVCPGLKLLNLHERPKYESGNQRSILKLASKMLAFNHTQAASIVV